MRRPPILAAVALAACAVLLLLAVPEHPNLQSENREAPTTLFDRASPTAHPAFNVLCLASAVSNGLTGLGWAATDPGQVLYQWAQDQNNVNACSAESNADQITNAFHVWAKSIGSALGNEVNQTWGGTGATGFLSLLNFSLVGWERAADHAALQQIGNTSFSIGEDLASSGVALGMDEIGTAFVLQSAAAVTPFYVAFNGHAASGEVYGGQSAAISGGSSNPGTWNPTSSLAYIIDVGMPIVGSASAVEAYIPHGVNLFVNQGATIAIQSVASKANWFNSTAGTAPLGDGNFTFRGPSGDYLVTVPLSDVLNIPWGGVIPTGVSGTSSSIAQASTNPCTFTGGAAYLYASVADGASSACLLSGQNAYSQSSFAVTGPGFTTYSYPAFDGPVSQNWPEYIGSLEFQAAENAEAYWAFLRTIGYTNAQQVPAGCIVPAPYLTMPSPVANLNLTLNQTEELYLSFLQGLGHFYNASLNETDFCGTQSTHRFSIGGAPWGNLFINATGAVYLTNGTTPTNEFGKSLPSEHFNNISSWALTGQQLVLMPTLSTATIPVGVRWAVPAKNPIEVFAVQAGWNLWLTGNGTGLTNNTGPCKVGSGAFCPEVTPIATLLPGDAIYLTSCTVSNAATPNCTVTVQTVNVTVTKLTCTGPCNQSAPPAGIFSFGNPFASFLNWLGSLFGGLFGSGLGGLLGSLFGSLILVAAVLLGIYIVYRLVSSSGRSGGTAGVTVVNAGGRR